MPNAQRDSLAAGRYTLVAETVNPVTVTTYVPPPPSVAPELAVGQRFLRVKPDLYALELTAEIVTLVGIDRSRRPKRLTFAPACSTAFTIDSDDDVDHLPGVRPLDYDANLGRAQQIFSGRDAWTLGMVELTCLGTLGKALILDSGTRVNTHRH